MGWLKQIKWDADGQVPAIGQDAKTGEAAMMTWMKLDVLALTLEHKRAAYWPRWRRKLGFKAEESGHVRDLKEIRVDSDADVVLLQVEKIGGIASHSRRRRCFFRVLNEGKCQVGEEIMKNPQEIYR